MLKKIYLIQKGATNHYKIGYSKNPNTRLKELQTANPETLHLVFQYETIEYILLERMLHANYNLFKVQGEWFELNDEQVSYFLNKCNQLMETINLLRTENYFYS